MLKKRWNICKIKMLNRPIDELLRIKFFKKLIIN